MFITLFFWDLFCMVWYVNVDFPLYYDHVFVNFFCGSSLYFFIKHNTSNIYKDVIVTSMTSSNNQRDAA